MIERMVTPQGRDIAFERLEGTGPRIVFLGGFKSDMEGTKAIHLRDWAAREGLAFTRLDYSGHGISGGAFEDGCIGDWAEDAAAVIGAEPVVLAGSSMGGWISLLLARSLGAAQVKGLVTIAAAPDFTEDSMWDGFDAAQKQVLMDEGRLALPSDYGAPYIITRRLIEEGRKTLVLRDPLPLPFPVRFLQGTADADVDMSVALRLLDHAEGPDMRLTLVKGADHRFSDDACLALIQTSVKKVLSRA